MTFVQSTGHTAKTLMELMMLMLVSNAKLAKIVRTRQNKLSLITAKIGIKMQITLVYILLIRRRSSFFPN